MHRIPRFADRTARRTTEGLQNGALKATDREKRFVSPAGASLGPGANSSPEGVSPEGLEVVGVEASNL
uniref:Protein of unassigned function n=1 Tax=Steinernema glaseri TaxID=37863 RepID=A0A1I7ZQK0_9BILA